MARIFCWGSIWKLFRELLSPAWGPFVFCLFGIAMSSLSSHWTVWLPVGWLFVLWLGSICSLRVRSEDSQGSLLCTCILSHLSFSSWASTGCFFAHCAGPVIFWKLPFGGLVFWLLLPGGAPYCWFWGGCSRSLLDFMQVVIFWNYILMLVGLHWCWRDNGCTSNKYLLKRRVERLWTGVM